MAEIPTLTIDMSDEFKQALKETREELETAKEALSEERIRAIVREELATWLEHNAAQLARVVAAEFAKSFGSPGRAIIYRLQPDGTYRADQ